MVLNCGSIDFNWTAMSFEVKVHNVCCDVVLCKGELGIDIAACMASQETENILTYVDGYFYQ